jgi:hypothetical protein
LSERAPIQRPKILAIAVFGFAAAAVAVGAGLFDLAARRSAAPAVVAVDKGDLEQALYEAPWTSSDASVGDEGGAPAADGAVLWMVTAPDCAPCRVFERETLPHLLDAGVEARVIVVAPRKAGLGTRAAREVAQLTKKRDWTGLHLWMQGKSAPAAALDPAEEEGVLEWGRQSSERINDVLERNDLKLTAPSLFWQDGPEWRASVNADRRAFRQIERALAPKA